LTTLSGQTIRSLGILSPCLSRRSTVDTLTGGLGPAGYDLSLDWGPEAMDADWFLAPGQFRLGATLERFTMPNNVIGMVCDKSSWARRGLSLFNTVIEPGWRGYLTLEMVNHSKQPLFLRQGTPIAQVVFHYLDEPAEQPYNGKYQDQAQGPQEAR
jgi:dCTP deaminase